MSGEPITLEAIGEIVEEMRTRNRTYRPDCTCGIVDFGHGGCPQAHLPVRIVRAAVPGGTVSRLEHYDPGNEPPITAAFTHSAHAVGVLAAEADRALGDLLQAGTFVERHCNRPEAHAEHMYVVDRPRGTRLLDGRAESNTFRAEMPWNVELAKCTGQPA